MPKRQTELSSPELLKLSKSKPKERILSSIRYLFNKKLVIQEKC